MKMRVDRRTFFQYSKHTFYVRKDAGGEVAQLVEQRTENPRVIGSIPILATILFSIKPNKIKVFVRFLVLYRFLLLFSFFHRFGARKYHLSTTLKITECQCPWWGVVPLLTV